MNVSGTNLTFSGWFIPEGVILEKAKSIKEAKPETLKGFPFPIPTFISVCPHCDNPVKWLTTGALPPYLTCSNCNKQFSILL